MPLTNRTVQPITTVGFTMFPVGGSANMLNTTSGNNATPVAGTIYWGSLPIPANVRLTGVNYTIGTVGGTTKVIAALYDAAGNLLANSALAGTTVGSANTKQQVPFTSPISVVGWSVYYIALQFDGTTARFLNLGNVEAGIVAGSSTGTFGTLPNPLAVGTTFTVNTAPFASTY